MSCEQFSHDNGTYPEKKPAERPFFPRGRFHASVLVLLFATVLFCSAGKAHAAFSELDAFTGIWCVDFEKTKKLWKKLGATADWTIIAVLKEMYHMDVNFKNRTLIEGNIEEETKRIPFTVKVKGGKLYMTITDDDKKKRTFVWTDRGDGTIMHDIKGSDHSEEGPLIMERHH